MRFHLQFGHGMKSLSCQLIQSWHSGRVILSPRDASPDQLANWAAEIIECGGRLWLDPQFYLPDTEHEKLRSHELLPDGYASGTFWEGPDPRRFIRRVVDLNNALHTDGIIIPGTVAETIDDSWLERHRTLSAEARRFAPRARLYSTIALSANATRTSAQIHELLDDLDDWDVNGIYLVSQRPDGAYLTDDASWL